MGNALRQFFSFFTTLFTAMEKIAQTVDNISTIGVEMSGAALDEARAERQAAMNALTRSVKASETAPAVS